MTIYLVYLRTFFCLEKEKNLDNFLWENGKTDYLTVQIHADINQLMFLYAISVLYKYYEYYVFIHSAFKLFKNDEKKNVFVLQNFSFLSFCFGCS